MQVKRMFKRVFSDVSVECKWLGANSLAQFLGAQKDVDLTSIQGIEHLKHAALASDFDRHQAAAEGRTAEKMNIESIGAIIENGKPQIPADYQKLTQQFSNDTIIQLYSKKKRR